MYMYTFLDTHTHTHMRESFNVSREHIPTFDEHLSWRIRSDGRGACPPDVFAHSAALSACEAAGKRGQDDSTPLDFSIERLFHVKCCWIRTGIVSTDSPFLSFSPLFQFLLRFPSFSILFVLKRILLSTSIFLTPRYPKEVAACPSAAISYGAADPSSRRHQCGRCGGCGAAQPGGAGSGGAIEGDLQRVAGCFRRCFRLDGGLGTGPWEKDQRMALDAKNTQFRSV